MDCRELFIGGYYDYDGDIIKMDSSKLSYILEIGGEYEYNPIPLTEEWLLKFGFIREQEGYVNSIILYKGKKHFNYNALYFEHENFVSIEYVHELQNLYFALTGEELELK